MSKSVLYDAGQEVRGDKDRTCSCRRAVRIASCMPAMHLSNTLFPLPLPLIGLV